MDWKPIDSAPTEGPMFLIGTMVVASEYHPTAAKGDFLYWEMACVWPHELEENIYLDSNGFNAKDFEFWAAIQPPAV